MTPPRHRGMLTVRPQAASPINSLPGRARAPRLIPGGCGEGRNTARS